MLYGSSVSCLSCIMPNFLYSQSFKSFSGVRDRDDVCDKLFGMVRGVVREVIIETYFVRAVQLVSSRMCVVGGVDLSEMNCRWGPPFFWRGCVRVRVLV